MRNLHPRQRQKLGRLRLLVVQQQAVERQPAAAAAVAAAAGVAGGDLNTYEVDRLPVPVAATHIK